MHCCKLQAEDEAVMWVSCDHVPDAIVLSIWLQLAIGFDDSQLRAGADSQQAAQCQGRACTFDHVLQNGIGILILSDLKL